MKVKLEVSGIRWSLRHPSGIPLFLKKNWDLGLPQKKQRKCLKLGWYQVLPAYTAENKINIYLPKDGSRFKKQDDIESMATPRPAAGSLVENVFGLSRHLATAIGTRPGGDDHGRPDAKWTYLTILPRNISSIWIYGSFLMIFFTYVGLIQGLPQ